MDNARNKLFVSFKLHVAVNSVMKSHLMVPCSILPRTENPSVMHIRTVQATGPLVTLLSYFLLEPVTLLQFLYSSIPYVTMPNSPHFFSPHHPKKREHKPERYFGKETIFTNIYYSILSLLPLLTSYHPKLIN
jgi:hypothetical protein